MKLTTRATLLIMTFALVGAGLVIECQCAFAAPPAEASATSPTKGAPQIPSPNLTYQSGTPNMVTRTLFSGSGIEILDMAVGPGQSAQFTAEGFAALIDVQAGSAHVSIDGKPAEPQSGGVFNVPEGVPVEIDNSSGTRPFLAREYKFSATLK